MKKCPFCNADLPDEAMFCLKCFSPLETTEDVSDEKEKPLFILNRKNLFGKISLILSVIIIIASCNLTIYSHKNKAPEHKVIGTSLVPVTEENGETVTDNSGDPILEVTEIATKEKSFFDKILGKSETEKSADEAVTKKPSFIDKLLGKNDETTTAKAQSSIASKVPASESSEPAPTNESKPSVSNGFAPPKASEPTTESAPPTTEAPPKSNPDDFEYAPESNSKSYLAISKYKGNSAHVVIPATYNGQAIVRISSNAFKDNPNVKIVTFEDDSRRPYLWLSSGCFYNCSNLHTINLPDEDLGIINNFATECYALRTITLKNTDQYRIRDGELYYYNSKGYILRYVCPASAKETIILPSWSTGIEGACNLSELSNTKAFVLHENVTAFPDQTNLPSNLENIYVSDNHKTAYDKNGILFHYNSSNSRYTCTYPPKNKTKDFTLPNNSLLYDPWVKNPYLETLRLEPTAELFGLTHTTSKWAFKNLKTIYVSSENVNASTIQKDFAGTVYVY